MKRLLQLLLCLTLLTGASAWAACVGPAQSAVQTAVNSAAAGATVDVCAGSATWSSAVNVSAKTSINLIGAGIGITNITCSSATCVTIGDQSGNSPTLQLAGFTFINGGGGDTMALYLIGPNNSRLIRIYNNRFQSSSVRWLISTGNGYVGSSTPWMLLHNNQFHNTMTHSFGTWAGLAEGSYQHQIWALPTPWGASNTDGKNVVVMEDNAYTDTLFGNATDCNYSGRYVFRFNTIVGQFYNEAHSVQGDNRSCQQWEIYHNTINYNQSSYGRVASLRGGSGVFFNNTYANNYEWVQLNNVRSCRDPGGTNGKCAGSSNWDQNSGGGSGYACRDQIGSGHDTSLWSVGGAYTQTRKPAYFWNNLRSGGGQVPITIDAGESCTPSDLNSTHLQANRDYYTYNASFTGASGVGVGTKANMPATCTAGVAYWVTNEGYWNSKTPGVASGVLYKCTAPNTWTAYYVPAPYPHPLRSGLAAPTGLTVK